METEEGVCYLSLITDAYSHMIVGWAVGPTLEKVYPLEALRMALSTIDDETAAMLIHHSNRGSQYCSQTYVQELKRYNISIYCCPLKLRTSRTLTRICIQASKHKN